MLHSAALHDNVMTAIKQSRPSRLTALAQSLVSDLTSSSSALSSAPKSHDPIETNRVGWLSRSAWLSFTVQTLPFLRGALPKV
jgi:hypothetical protein